MAKIYQQIRHESGIPLGGIGAGTVEIQPDGLFHEWQIFNTGKWSPATPCLYPEDVHIVKPDDSVFIVRTKTSGGDVIVRYLALREELHDLYVHSWIKSVKGILFDGQYPVATLTYVDDALPVEIQVEFFSPFIPHDSRNSGTPGFYVHFTVKNTSDTPVEVSILGCIRNTSGIGQNDRIPHNRLRLDDGTAVITLGADALKAGDSTTGDMAFSVRGGDISYVTGSQQGRAVKLWCGLYGPKIYSYLHEFHSEGRLPDLNAEIAPVLPDGFSASTLSDKEQKELLSVMLQHPFIYDKFQQIRASYPDLAEDRESLEGFLDDIVSNLGEIGDQHQEWGEAALCSKHTLAPGEEKETLFTVSWCFPNHISPAGNRQGHMYENWFDNALDVNNYLNANFTDFRKRTLALPESIYNSSLDGYCADAVSAQLSTLTKCTWWTKAGHFGVWEGIGCCGFNTTDVAYYASFPIIALFPDLQKEQMIHGAKFQRDDGRVYHFFAPDFSQVDEGFERVDMNQQFVIQAARDYQWTGDREYLAELWPRITLAMENTAKLDLDGDGLPDHDTKRNTYDVWDFAGCPSFIASLWLAALKAGVDLAKAVGDEKRASEWESIYVRGVSSLESKLWNGEYYILWTDELNGLKDECCMSDQMSGDWFNSIMGWSPICDPQHIRKALECIVKHNFRPDWGLINASYPTGVAHRQPTSGNRLAIATWTGIEYAVASFLIENGMVSEGLAIVRDIHVRHLQSGKFWNHFECGNHYYRAMASWTVLLALSGFRLDVPAGEIAFNPAVKSDQCSYPFFTSEAAGTYRQSAGVSGACAEIEVLSGNLTVSSVEIPRLSCQDGITVTVNGELVPYTADTSEDKIHIRVETPVALQEGGIFRIF